MSVIDAYPESSENNDIIDIHNDDIDLHNDDDEVEEDDDDEYLDKIAIAALKPVKMKRIRRKEITEEEAEEFNQVLRKSNLKVKDFVK